MSNNGKQGERLFQGLMNAKGFVVKDVSGNADYFSKDIDFIITNPTTGNTRTFEVKWDQRIYKTGNMFLEIENPRSKQWNGQGWWLHCQADYLVYGDAVSGKFYIMKMDELRQRVEAMHLPTRCTSDLSVGMILPLDLIRDIVVEEEILCQKLLSRLF